MTNFLIASGGASTIWGLHPSVWHLINFIIFAAIIGFLLKKFFAPYMRERSKAVRKEIEDAQKMRSEMEAKFQEYEERLKSIDDQIDTIVSTAKDEADLEKARLIKEATAAAERMKADAKTIADQEVERARRELLEETMLLATKAAEEALKKQVTPEDQERLAEEFLTKVGD